MVSVITGDRVGKQGRLRLGCSGVLFDSTGERVLLTRRTDNGRWCLPGGQMEPGESAAEACEREVREETGLLVHVDRLIGIYTSPHRLFVYADGNRWQFVSLCFAVGLVGGSLTLSNETTDAGYFSAPEIANMDLLESHHDRIRDALAQQPAAFMR